MSFQITEAFVKQFSSNLMLRAQQSGSRLRETVTVVNGVGNEYFFDYVGAVEAQNINDRHGDSPINSTPQNRRSVLLAGYDTGDLIDTIDKVQMLADPASPFVETHGRAMGRKLDDVIIASAFADARTGVAGASATSFTAGNIVAVNSTKYGTASGNTGLTIGKLIEARNILVEAEGVDDNEPLYFVCTGKQISNLLATTEATSADYNSVQALVRGQIDTFMGFKFIRSQRVLTDSNSYRRCIAYAKSGIGLAIGKDIVSQVSQRADKRFSWYAYFQMFVGATRLEEEKVVEVKCVES